jgi:hypothetical protein
MLMKHLGPKLISDLIPTLANMDSNSFSHSEDIKGEGSVRGNLTLTQVMMKADKVKEYYLFQYYLSVFIVLE